MIALNGNCASLNVGGCSASSAQTAWLRSDLAATLQPCVLAFWHQPLWTGHNKNLYAYKPWWNALYAANADVVLNGHVHDYQRFLPLDPAGASDPVNGLTEYIVGTGGESQMPRTASLLPMAAAYAKSFGYLRMTLLPTGWTAQFLDTTGAVLDTSSGTCHP